MATEWISPTWRMPNDKNQSKFENYSLDFAGASLEHVMLGNGGNDTDLLPGQPTVAGTVNNPNFSVSAFFNFDSAISGSLRNIIGAGQTGGATYWYLRKNASDNIEFTVRTEVGSPYYVTVTGSTVLNSDQWYHGVVSWDGTTITLYLDGTSEATAAATTFYFGGGPGTEWPTIGSYYRGATTQSSLWDGKIAQPCIFDYALSQGQVTYLHNSGTPQNPMAISGQPPVAYYPLGGSSTGDAADPATTLTVPNESVADATVFESDPGFFDLPGSSLAPILSGISNFTLSLWYKQDAVSNRFLFDIKDGTNRMALQLVNASTNYFYFNSAFNAYSAVDTPINQWNNVVFVFDGSQANVDRIKLYVNGSRITASITGTIDATLGTFGASTLANLAAASTGGSLYALNGEIANTQMWTTSLGAPEITTLYNYGSPLSGTQPQAANLKAWYPMNVENANWLGSDWQIADAVSAYPQSFNFVESSTQYIDIGTNNSLLMPTDEMSISLWVNFSAAAMGNTRGLFSANSASGYDGYVIWKDNSNKIAFLINDGSWKIATRPTAVVQDTWYHVVGTWDGSTARIYVNNVDEGNVSVSSINYNASTVNRIGDYANDEMDGNMSNVQFWNKGLSAANVTTLYNNGSPLTTAIESSNLKAWYKLDNTETYLTPNSSQTQNLYEGWLAENKAYPASINKSLLFGLGTDVRYNGFNLSNQPEITYSFWWMNDNSVNSWDLIVGNRHGTYYNLRVYQNRSGSPNVYAGLKTNDGAGGSNTATVYLGNITTPTPGWRLLTFTYDGSTFKGYLNETEIDSASITGSLYDVSPYGTNGEVSIRDSSGSAQGMRISNLVIWNKGLTGPEVSTLYNTGTPLLTKDSIPQDSSMLLWNTLENKTETSGGGLYDKSENSVAIRYLTQPDNITISTSPVSAQNGISSGMTESNLVNNNVSVLNGTSDGMTTANLVNSDLTRSIPYNSYSMEFDGTADVVTIGSTSLGITSAISISAWVKTTDTASSYKVIFCEDNTSGTNRSWNLFVNSSRKLSFMVWNTDGSLNYLVRTNIDEVQDGNWHHVVATYDGTTNADGIKLYVDGSPESMTATSTGIRTTASLEPTIGGLTNSGGWYWPGSLSNIGVWSSALTQDQILTIYNGGVPNSISSLSPVSWWSLAGDSYYDGTNWICPDLGSGGNNGTSSGMGGTELVGDGPGSTANGIATSMDIPANLKGDAPNSSSNAFSVNMDSQDRVSGSGNVPG